MNKKLILRFIFSMLISIILLFLLLSNIKIKDLLIITRANSVYLILGFGFYIAILIFRTIRFKVLLNKKNLLPVVLVHNALNYLLPFKLGEISFPALIKKKNGSFKKALSSLIVARAFDLIVIILVLVIGMIISNNPILNNILVLLVILFMLILTMLFILIFYPSLLLIILNRTNKLIPEYLIKNIRDVINNFKSYKSKTLLVKTFIISLFTFFSGFFTTYFLILAIGYSIPFTILIAVIPLGVLSGIIPINGIAGFGTFESFWVVALVFFGYSLETAVIISISIHIIQLIYTLILGLIGWLIL